MKETLRAEDRLRKTSRRSVRSGLAACIALLGVYLCAGAATSAPPATLDTPQAEAGYSAGYEFGSRLAGMRIQGNAIELEAVFQGILDALSGAEPLVDQAHRRAALDRPETPATKKPALDIGSDTARLPARTGGFRDDYARLNATREGVVVLPSGVQYEVLSPGSGKQPHTGDTVVVRYVGSLTNGTVFDSTREDEKPARLALDTIAVPGLREALLHMPEGARWRVVIPPPMGFGRTGNNMLRRRDLIYEIELLAVEAPEKNAANPSEAANAGKSP